MVTRLEAQVHGLVQGVFFRHHTRLRAQALGVSGSVENCPNGSVRVVAEGEKHSLEQLLAWLQVGPELAAVDRVESRWGESNGTFSGFVILR